MESGLVFPDDLENFLAHFYIPSYILSPDARAERLPDVPESPVLVFINSKSGGQLGAELLVTYRSLLNKRQVTTPFNLFFHHICRSHSLEKTLHAYILMMPQTLQFVIAKKKLKG